MKCIVLFSGGIDSILTCKILQEQGIEVEGITVDISLNLPDNREKLFQVAEKTGIHLEIIDDTDHFLKNILFQPQHGYGKGINPCVDCHANFIRLAWQYAQKHGASFIASGEVLGQRGMSQVSSQMQKVDALLGEAAEYILRPLSAQLLPPTIPEMKGWVDRSRLLAIEEKSKKKQMDLLRKYNIHDFLSSPGCLLTQKDFTRRITFFSRRYQITSNNTGLLKTGRHININEHLLILGRDKEENAKLKQIHDPRFVHVTTRMLKSPVALIDQNADEETQDQAARIILTYSKPLPEEDTAIIIHNKAFHVEPSTKESINHLIIQ